MREVGKGEEGIGEVYEEGRYMRRRGKWGWERGRRGKGGEVIGSETLVAKEARDLKNQGTEKGT